MMCDISSVVSGFSSEIRANMGYIAPWLMIAVFLPILLYLLTKFTRSGRRLIIYAEEMKKNLIVSLIALLAAPFILLLVCLFTNTITSQTAGIEMAEEKMALIEDVLAYKIKLYRELAIEHYASDAIERKVVGSPLFGNTLMLPTDNSAKAKIFLQRANDAVGGLNFLLISIALQRFILSFLSTFSELFYFLLLGALVIRLFPPFKEAGDFLFSMSLALFLILPAVYVVLTEPFTLGLPSAICEELNSHLSGFSYTFFTPISSCYDVALISSLTVYAIFLPNIAYGLTFSFASNFKRFFDVFEGLL